MHCNDIVNLAARSFINLCALTARLGFSETLIGRFLELKYLTQSSGKILKTIDPESA